MTRYAFSRYNGGWLVALACLSLPAHADERALQAALSKAQYMLKQATADKLAAEQKLTRVQTEFDQYKKASEKQVQQAQLKGQQGSAQLTEKVDLMKTRYTELQGKYVQLKQEYIKLSKSGNNLDSQLKVQQDNFQLCLENNRKLYDINQEILGNYQDKGFWDVMQESEPFTGFKTVKVENLIQDYQYKNEDLRVDEALLGAASADQ